MGLDICTRGCILLGKLCEPQLSFDLALKYKYERSISQISFRKIYHFPFLLWMRDDHLLEHVVYCRDGSVYN